MAETNNMEDFFPTAGSCQWMTAAFSILTSFVLFPRSDIGVSMPDVWKRQLVINATWRRSQLLDQTACERIGLWEGGGRERERERERDGHVTWRESERERRKLCPELCRTIADCYCYERRMWILGWQAIRAHSYPRQMTLLCGRSLPAALRSCPFASSTLH